MGAPGTAGRPAPLPRGGGALHGVATVAPLQVLGVIRDLPCRGDGLQGNRGRDLGRGNDGGVGDLCLTPTRHRHRKGQIHLLLTWYRAGPFDPVLDLVVDQRRRADRVGERGVSRNGIDERSPGGSRDSGVAHRDGIGDQFARQRQGRRRFLGHAQVGHLEQSKLQAQVGRERGLVAGVEQPKALFWIVALDAGCRLEALFRARVLELDEDGAILVEDGFKGAGLLAERSPRIKAIVGVEHDQAPPVAHWAGGKTLIVEHVVGIAWVQVIPHQRYQIVRAEAVGQRAMVGKVAGGERNERNESVGAHIELAVRRTVEGEWKADVKGPRIGIISERDGGTRGGDVQPIVVTGAAAIDETIGARPERRGLAVAPVRVHGLHFLDRFGRWCGIGRGELRCRLLRPRLCGNEDCAHHQDQHGEQSEGSALHSSSLNHACFSRRDRLPECVVGEESRWPVR